MADASAPRRRDVGWRAAGTVVVAAAGGFAVVDAGWLATGVGALVAAAVAVVVAVAALWYPVPVVLPPAPLPVLVGHDEAVGRIEADFLRRIETFDQRPRDDAHHGDASPVDDALSRLVTRWSASIAADWRMVMSHLAHRLLANTDEGEALIQALVEPIEDPDLIKPLHAIDHLQQRQGQLAACLAALSGASHVTTVSQEPIPLYDAVRGGVSRIATYWDVDIQPSPGERLLRADTAHALRLIITELADNAAKYRQGSKKVEVVFITDHPDGFVIEIRDTGMPLPHRDKEEHNRLLRECDARDVERRLPSGRLGLTAVAVTARRHDIAVQLFNNSVRGVSAMVMLPCGLFVDTPPAAPCHDGADAEMPEAGSPVAVSWQSPVSQQPPRVEEPLPQRPRRPSPYAVAATGPDTPLADASMMSRLLQGSASAEAEAATPGS